MAKFCSNCGSQMNDEDKVCGQCGTPVAGANVNPAPVAAPAADEGKKKNNNIIIALIAIAIVAIVALVVVVNIASNFTGYKGTLNKMVKALEDDDTDALIALSSSISDEINEAWYGDDFEEYYEDAIDSVLDKYEDKVENIKKISYEITDETELSKRNMEDLEEAMVDNYDMDFSDIKKVVKVDLKITVKGSKKSGSYNVEDLIMVKEDGGWKIHYGSLNY